MKPTNPFRSASASTMAPSLEPEQDIPVDPPQLAPAAASAPQPHPPASPVAAVSPTASHAEADREEEEDGLEHQTKEFLLQRVRALERQLKIRNGDCARLLSERQQLLPLREKCDSQKEMILALRGQLDLARAQRESAIDAMEAMKRQQRDQEHRERVDHAERAMYGTTNNSTNSPAPPRAPLATSSKDKQTSARDLSSSGNGSGTPAAPTSPSKNTNAKTGSNNNNNNNSAAQAPSSSPNLGRRAPGGTVVNTSAGPQILYDTSDISSVGFAANARLPYDFLGGPGAQQQYLARYHGRRGTDAGDVPDGGHDESEDAQVQRMMGTAKDQADMEAKYKDMEDKEEEELLARVRALRQGRK